MEGNVTEIPLLGKLVARTPLPIPTGDRADDLILSHILLWREMVLGNRTSAISARISGNAKKRKDILNPQNRRYNCGKCRVLNYSTWSVRG